MSYSFELTYLLIEDLLYSSKSLSEAESEVATKKRGERRRESRCASPSLPLSGWKLLLNSSLRARATRKGLKISLSPTPSASTGSLALGVVLSALTAEEEVSSRERAIKAD
ncbi:hypothetical protein BCR35DRAFT_206031 [Leucosporidium creatinivorum]|uniref:Uncharacterized protein n=1 Tax=Leucosporidium creatinivorum TaxID=106004 RepID=A0A1Y2FXL0_9BASI|nr:hypothetical protein BCR35DRAFT_206031 [Leucosporidium creatinivorum]